MTQTAAHPVDKIVVSGKLEHWVCSSTESNIWDRCSKKKVNNSLFPSCYHSREYTWDPFALSLSILNSFSFSRLNALSLSLSLSHTHTHPIFKSFSFSTKISLSLSLSHTPIQTHSVSHMLSLSLIHSYTLPNHGALSLERDYYISTWW